MAREFGQLDSAAWRDDDDWRDLPADCQWLYALLVSQSDLTAAGVLHLAINRWRKMCADMTEERFREALTTLEERRFVLVDFDSEELIVRSFARRKTQWSNSKRVGALRSAVAQIHSLMLRQVLANELHRIGKTVNGLPEPLTDGMTEPMPVALVERMPIGLGNVSTSTGREVPEETGDGRREKRDASAKRPQKRATAAPDIFPVSDGMRRFVNDHEIPTDVARIETDRFLDYHRAKGNTFKDWEAAWRTWMGKVARDLDRQRPNAEDKPAVSGVVGAGRIQLDSSLL